MDSGTFTFGKHRGLPACDVPVNYLAWCMATMASPPEIVLAELRRRADRHGSREAIAAQAALGSYRFRAARKEARRASNKRPKGRTKNGEFIGKEFAASRARFTASGGDLRECPF